MVLGCFLSFISFREIVLQIHTVGVVHSSVRSFRHGVWRSKGNAPIQEEPKPGPHRMRAGFHDDKAALGNGLQFVRRQQGALHHLEALAGVVLAPAHGAGEDGAAAQGFGQHFGSLAVGGKAAEDGVLAVVLNDLAALFPVVFFELRLGLVDRHEC